MKYLKNQKCPNHFFADKTECLLGNLAKLHGNFTKNKIFSLEKKVEIA